MKPTFYIIIGKKENGKDELAKALNRKFGLKTGACSDAIYADFAETLEEDRRHALANSRVERYKVENLFGAEEYEVKKLPPAIDLPPRIPTCLLLQALKSIPKHIFRPYLIARGDLLTSEEPAALVLWNINQGVQVLTGIRRRFELLAAKSILESRGFQPVVVWVDRPDHQIDNVDNLELTKDDADINYSVGEYQDKTLLGYAFDTIAENLVTKQ